MVEDTPFNPLTDFPDFFDVISFKWILLLVVVCIIRSWLKGHQFRERVSAKKLVAVVTGPTGGIGKQIVRELNNRGAKVHLLCRDKNKADEALTHLVSMGCNPTRLIVHIADLADFSSVQKCADTIIDQEEKLDVLVCNAAVMLYPRFQLTKDGHELTWQTNYLGHFLLTQMLLPLLEKSGSGRIVNVSALALYYADKIDLETINQRSAWDGRQAYAKSKLAQVMQTVEMTRRLREKGSAVTINSCHPGICRTSIARHTPLSSNPILRITLSPLSWYFLKTPKDGAQTPLHLCLSKDLNGVSGKYFSELTEKSIDEANSMDEESCNALYEYSMEAVGLSKPPVSGEE